MKLYTFTTVDQDAEVEVFLIQAAKKPTLNQAICLAYDLEKDDEAIEFIKDSYSLEIKPSNVLQHR